jgi:hypothetical protein
MGELIRRSEGGKIWRWERRDEPWAGARRWISLEGLEVILGQRLSPEAHPLEARCGLEDFVSGCFHNEVRARFGAEVLAEALKEARVGEGAVKAAKVAPAAARPEAEARAPRRAVVTSQGLQEAPARPAREGERLALAGAGDAEVGLVLTRAARVDLPLAAALKELLGVKVGSLGSALGRLPAPLSRRLGRAEAEAAQRRLRALGAEVVLTAAS